VARSQEQYLADIDEAMADARTFAEGHDLEDFLENRQLRYAIERALEIIGEATSNLSEEVKGRAPSLPWREMRGLRNIVAHAYHRVDPARVWRVVTRDLPHTHEKIRSVLEEVRKEGKADS
jgi:uncharacterized protein with HEPN domain